MKKILYVNWGGIGDHLAFTTLPEIFSNLGYEFYISDKSIFRDPKVYDLLWGSNPYVKGFSSEPANCGHTENWGVDKPVVFEKELTAYRNIEIIYGVDNGNDYGKLYYKPNLVDNVDDYILLDLNSFTIREYDSNNIKQHLLKYKDEKFLVVLNDTYASLVVNEDFFNDLNVEFIKTRDVFHYADLISSCKKFMCVWSGSSLLSSVIKHQYNNELEIDCFKKTIDDKSPSDFGKGNKSFGWCDNINYVYC